MDLAGYSPLQREEPGVERRLCPVRSSLRRMGLEAVRVRQNGGDGPGHEGGMEEWLTGEHGRSALIASRRLTDLSSLMLSVTSPRMR
jgi:hypothetical protein